MVRCYSNDVLTYFRMKSIRVSFKASSNRPKPIDLMFEVICTAAAVARIAELTVRKTVAITTHEHTLIYEKSIRYLSIMHYLLLLHGGQHATA